jgi:hypothetical protein
MECDGNGEFEEAFDTAVCDIVATLAEEVKNFDDHRGVWVINLIRSRLSFKTLIFQLFLLEYSS